MLTVTDRALDVLETTLDTNAGGDGELLRIDEVQGQMALTIDQGHPGDQLVTKNEDKTVLAIAPGISNALDGMTLDVDEAEEGVRLVFRQSDGQLPPTNNAQ